LRRHRLFLGDERKVGSIPLAVLFAAALVERGYALRLFVAGIDETTVRMLQLLCRQPVTVLDPYLAGGDDVMRAIFQCASSDGALNLIIGPLLAKGSNEETVTVDRGSLRVLKALETPVMPILYADMSAVLAARRCEQVFSQISEGAPQSRQMGVCFASVLNPREYQLLEIELGRRIPLISMGFLPSHVHRDIPGEDVLFTADSHSMKITSLRSAVVQVRHMEDQIIWPLVEAMGQMAPEWPEAPFPCEPLDKPCQVGVVRHPALSVGGDGALHLFRSLGAQIVEFLPDSEMPPDLGALWVPHGRALWAADQMVDDPRFRKGLGRIAMQNKPFLVEGESSALLGEHLTVEAPSSSRRGICLVSCQGRFGKTVGYDEERRVELEGLVTGPLMRSGERCRGYWPRHFSLTSPASQRAEWAVMDAKDRGQIATDGWSLKRGVISQMRLELWSCIDGVRRWLSGA